MTTTSSTSTPGALEAVPVPASPAAPASSSSPSVILAPHTASTIPCCLCGTMIFPNAANQCSTCLAQQVNLQQLLQQGPGGADFCTIYQCRQCRRFQKTPKYYQHAEPESPELLALCLKRIPALTSSSTAVATSTSSSSSSSNKLHLVDAGWIWTEPHSMRLKLHLTVRTEFLQVQVQQRVMVELRCAWQMCPDCNREYTNRTWQALVQCRQKRTSTTNSSNNNSGLAMLEVALAKNHQVRKHVLRIDSAKNGFDFYFLTVPHAQAFAAFLQRIAPMRTSTSRQLVSTDNHNNTANIKHTLVCDLVPLCRHDLVLVHKHCKNAKLAGRLALVTKVQSAIHMMDASPSQQHQQLLQQQQQHRSSSASTTTSSSLDIISQQFLQMELSPESYYKNEKWYTVVQASHRLVRFVVLDVELLHSSSSSSPSGNSNHKDALLAEVVVARESDFGTSHDETFTCLTALPLGCLIRAGDVVLGYDLQHAQHQSLLQESEESSDGYGLCKTYVVPDVVLVKKVKGNAENNNKKNKAPAAVNDDNGNANNEEYAQDGKRLSKKKLRRQKKEGKKRRELEESAYRMGFLEEDHPHHHDKDDGNDKDHAELLSDDYDYDDGGDDDPKLQAELVALEQEFSAMETMTEGDQKKDSGDYSPAENGDEQEDEGTKSDEGGPANRKEGS